MTTIVIISAISNLALVTSGNILDDTSVFSCIGSTLQINNAIHLGRDPSLLLCGVTLCGLLMAALGKLCHWISIVKQDGRYTVKC
jgi:hypothetical protein